MMDHQYSRSVNIPTINGDKHCLTFLFILPVTMHDQNIPTLKNEVRVREGLPARWDPRGMPPISQLVPSLTILTAPYCKQHAGYSWFPGSGQEVAGHLCANS